MKLIVAGSREITDYNIVKETIDGLIAKGIVITAIIDGAARGVDSLASRYALEHGIENIRVPAEWKLYHKGAGPVRNRKMAEMGDALLVIWDGNSSGTKYMIACARNKNIPVYVHYYIETASCANKSANNEPHSSQTDVLIAPPQHLTPTNKNNAVVNNVI